MDSADGEQAASVAVGGLNLVGDDLNPGICFLGSGRWIPRSNRTSTLLTLCFFAYFPFLLFLCIVFATFTINKLFPNGESNDWNLVLCLTIVIFVNEWITEMYFSWVRDNREYNLLVFFILCLCIYLSRWAQIKNLMPTRKANNIWLYGVLIFCVYFWPVGNVQIWSYKLSAWFSVCIWTVFQAFCFVLFYCF